LIVLVYRLRYFSLPTFCIPRFAGFTFGFATLPLFSRTVAAAFAVPFSFVCYVLLRAFLPVCVFVVCVLRSFAFHRLRSRVWSFVHVRSLFCVYAWAVPFTRLRALRSFAVRFFSVPSSRSRFIARSRVSSGRHLRRFAAFTRFGFTLVALRLVQQFCADAVCCFASTSAQFFVGGAFRFAAFLPRFAAVAFAQIRVGRSRFHTARGVYKHCETRARFSLPMVRTFYCAHARCTYAFAHFAFRSPVLHRYSPLRALYPPHCVLRFPHRFAFAFCCWLDQPVRFALV